MLKFLSHHRDILLAISSVNCQNSVQILRSLAPTLMLSCMIWQSERAMYFTGLCVETLSPHLVALFVKVMESVGGGTLQEKVHYWGQALSMFSSLSLFPVCG